MNVGYNLATYKSHMLFLMEQRFSSAGSLHFTDALIFRMLNEAQREFQKRLRMGDTLYDHTITSVDDQGRYDLPLDVLGGVIREVGISSAGAAWTPLTHVSLNRVDGQYREGGTITDTKGTPVQWALDERYRKIIVMPQTSGTGFTIGIRYDHTPTPPWRIYQPSAVTASADNVTTPTAVTLSDTPPDGWITAAGGDEFGIVRTEQTDGKSVSHGEPHRWYKIASWATTTITLEAETPYAEPDATNLAFIVAEVLEIDKWHPGRFGWNIPLYAAGLLYQQSPQPDAAAVSLAWRTEALGNLEAMQKDEDGVFTPGTVPGGARVGGPQLNR